LVTDALSKFNTVRLPWQPDGNNVTKKSQYHLHNTTSKFLYFAKEHYANFFKVTFIHLANAVLVTFSSPVDCVAMSACQLCVKVWLNRTSHTQAGKAISAHLDFLTAIHLDFSNIVQ